jgi:uncharacterized membrane protein YjdF
MSMKEELKLKIVSIFTALYLIIFTIITVLTKNHEFLYYIIIIGIFIGIIIYHHKSFHLTLYIIIGLSVIGFMHIAGGVFYPYGTRLYDTYLIKNFLVLRYDNLIHTFGIFIATFVSYNMLKPHLSTRIKNNKFLLALILILMALGIGAIIEVLEFGAVIFLGAAEQVGDYFNNAWDLVFNLTGSIIACFFILYYHGEKLREK